MLKEANNICLIKVWGGQNPPSPVPPSLPPSLGASAQWPLPLVVHHQPTCSSDSQCYGQTASQWKMPQHFLSFTNTVWNKSPYQTWGLFIVLIGGKINVLCISTALFKQDKNCMSRSKAAGIEWVVGWKKHQQVGKCIFCSFCRLDMMVVIPCKPPRMIPRGQAFACTP